MLPRVLEPEVMDTAEEASDYDAMDHGAVNRAFAADLLAGAPDLSRALDVGTGTALIAIELCRLAPNAHVVATDLADHMLALAARNVANAGLAARITLERRDAKATGFADGAFTTVMSNSLVHHVPDVGALVGELARVVAPGGMLFVRDLARPADQATLDALVATYAAVPDGARGQDRARAERQRALFAASLHAALTIDEVHALAAAAGMRGARAFASSDRHFTLVWKKP